MTSWRADLRILTTSAAGMIPALLLFLPAQVGAQTAASKSDSFLAPLIAHPRFGGRIQTIVQFRQPLTYENKVRLHALSADIYQDLPIIRSAAVSVPSGNLKRLAALS